MNLEEKKILGLLNSLASAELLFVDQKKAVLVLDGAGANGSKARGCFEVALCLDHDEMMVQSATIHGVTPFKPGYVKLDGRHDLDGGDLFSTLSNSWVKWWQAASQLAYADYYSQDHHALVSEKLRQA